MIKEILIGLIVTCFFCFSINAQVIIVLKYIDDYEPSLEELQKLV